MGTNSTELPSTMAVECNTSRTETEQRLLERKRMREDEGSPNSDQSSGSDWVSNHKLAMNQVRYKHRQSMISLCDGSALSIFRVVISQTNFCLLLVPVPTDLS